MLTTETSKNCLRWLTLERGQLACRPLNMAAVDAGVYPLATYNSFYYADTPGTGVSCTLSWAGLDGSCRTLASAGSPQLVRQYLSSAYLLLKDMLHSAPQTCQTDSTFKCSHRCHNFGSRRNLIHFISAASGQALLCLVRMLPSQ